MIAKDEQIKILKIYIENIEELIEEDDVQAVLDSIDDIIVDNILKNDETREEADGHINSAVMFTQGGIKALVDEH